MRAVARNINFPVVDIFHSRSKEPLPLRIAVASPRYTTTFNINTFAPENINTIDPIPSPVSIKQGLRTTEYGLRTTDYGLGIKHGLRYKTRTKHCGLGIRYELGIKHGLGYEQAHWV